MGPAAREYPEEHVIPGSKYKVIRKLGGGGMGTVYDVEDISIGKKYVLKTLHAHLGDREDLARRLAIESRVLARLHHPNIVEVITAGITEDELRLPYYVMERLKGYSLRSALEKKQLLDVPHALHIAIDLLDALDHAHECGVIHRDVKPDNIFLHTGASGVTVTKLLDFGIVSILDAANRETAGRFIGTMRYAAPEQLQGAKATVKVDVYGAALVLYEMLAGRGPFDDEGDSQKIAMAHIHKRPPRVSRYVIVPPELDALIAAALEKDPDKRPRDAHSFAASLRNLKRALGGQSSDHASTGKQATGMALGLQAPPAPLVEVQAPAAPGAPYVVSPGPVQVPRTTVRDMATPTMGRPPAQASPSLDATARDGEGVDRDAATRTRAHDVPPAQPDRTMPMPSVRPEEPIAPIRFPPDKPPEQSDEPHVRSLPMSAERGNGARTAIAVAVAGALGLGVLVTTALVLHRASSVRSAPAAESPAAAPSTTSPPLPQPVVTLPAPTIAPPALDETQDPPAASPTAAIVKPPTPKPRASSAPKTPPASPPAAPAAPAPGPDRPGPGF
jgi:serine/threonine-protein kinase